MKVRGHSNQQGNDAADKAATWGQNGGSKNVENMKECMEWLEMSTRELNLRTYDKSSFDLKWQIEIGSPTILVSLHRS